MRLSIRVSVGFIISLAVLLSAQVAVGSEFQVNTYTTSYQRTPWVAAASDGSFIVVWYGGGSAATDASFSSVHAQRYASDGTPQGGEFQVNTDTFSFQSQPSVAAAPGGNFVVAWLSFAGTGSDTSGESIHAQRFGADGTPQGEEFQVNSYTTGIQRSPVVAIDADGNFVVAWYSAGSAGTDTDSTSVQAQLFASDGTPEGDEFQVNSYTTSSQAFPSVVVGAAGDFVVAWQSYGSAESDTSSFSIQAQLFGADGTPQGVQFQVNSYTTDNQSFPSVAVGADGDFVVAWTSKFSPSDHDFGIQAQRYAAAGTPQGDQFQVNSYTPYAQSSPTVAADAEGNFVVAWSSYGSAGTDTDTLSIHAQRLRADGTPQGGEFQVNTYTTGKQRWPRIAAGVLGNLVVVWESEGSAGTDTDNSSIQAQRYEAPLIFTDGFESGDTTAWSASVP